MPLKPIGTDSVDYLKALVIARYGIGKTSLIRTIFGQRYNDGEWSPPQETDERVLVLSAEGGLLAVRDLVRAGMIEGYEISSILELEEAFNLANSSQEFKERYTWIFIDSLTEIASRCEEDMQRRYPDASASFRMWGEYSKKMKQLIKGFRDIQGYSVLFTCLETVDKDESNRRYMAPAMAGKRLKEELPSYFDLVLYMGVMQTEAGDDRVLYTQPVNDFPAKDRSGCLDPIEYPDLLNIKLKIFG